MPGRLRQRDRGIRGIVERTVEHDKIELRRFEGQRIEIGLNRREPDRIVAARPEAVGLVIDAVDRDDRVSQRGEPMRHPSAAGAQIQHSPRSVSVRAEHVPLQVSEAVAPDAPLVRAGIAGRDARQHLVVLGNNRAITVAGPYGAVLLEERRGCGGTVRRQESQNASLITKVGAPARVACETIPGRTNRHPTLGARESGQPRVGHIFLNTIRK